MESVWYLLKTLYKKDLLYKGYTIQPYSPKAGTGLSSHELNQPGTYRDVKDTTIVAQFKVIRDEKSEKIFEKAGNDPFFIAWTTTPWTLPSNTALTVGKNITYVLVDTYNQYTEEKISVILAKDLLSKYFNPEHENQTSADIKISGKTLPHSIVGEFKGSELLDIKYEQLLPFALPFENADKAFRVIAGDFVTTEDGTGIVHTAPTFGADDAMVAKVAGVPPLLVKDDEGNSIPLVDLQGKFIDIMGEYAGKYVKNEYYDASDEPDRSVDVEIAIRLKEENRAFKVEKYEHSYPHCWRTDKPVLYYPLDSWFVKSTMVKDELIANNKKINWKPASTGEGRFGNWLENLQDWNLSRSRFWGIPIPIWVNEKTKELKVIGSLAELKSEIKKSVDAGVMSKDPFSEFEPGDMSEENYDKVDLHKHIVDQIILVDAEGSPMIRESDLIDVWFDSGSMPYAQWHYPFENKEIFEQNYPADFIAEGVDQTRGWFFTLHAIATMTQKSVAFKNVVSNGLVLDKNGQKMSKRLGNAVDPFKTLDKYGPDATRWYMISNAQPWDNLKFDLEGITEVQRKFFRALHNSYAFFALYANVDGFAYNEDEIDMATRPEIDRWIISRLNTLVEKVKASMDDYEPTKATRLIQEFVVDDFSNWWVRLCRKRFWRGDYAADKISAYQTMYQCLETVAIIASPVAPFYCDQLFRDLNSVSGKNVVLSVHHTRIPGVNTNHQDEALEERMAIAQKAASLILALRKKESIRVRQPLQRVMVPALEEKFKAQLKLVEPLICGEVNIKEIEIIDPNNNLLIKQIKPDFKVLGPKFGKQMKQLAGLIMQFGQEEINELESTGKIALELNGEHLELTKDAVEITSQDVPGWSVATDGKITVALDINISEELHQEGLARELVNRIQNLRKDSGFEVTDRINVNIAKNEFLQLAVKNNLDYIRTETLTDELNFSDSALPNGLEVELEEGLVTQLEIEKI